MSSTHGCAVYGSKRYDICANECVGVYACRREHGACAVGQAGGGGEGFVRHFRLPSRKGTCDDCQKCSDIQSVAQCNLPDTTKVS